MFELPNLPYAHDALEPVISQATMHLHHGKHHKRYFDVMNQMLQEAGAKPASLEEVVRGAVLAVPRDQHEACDLARSRPLVEQQPCHQQKGDQTDSQNKLQHKCHQE